MTVYALRLENNTDTAARMRLGDLLALPAGAAPLTSYSGLRADGGGVVTVTAGTMNVNVAPFIAWIQGGTSVVQGGYPFVCDAAVALPISAGHASLSRTDTIAAVVQDNTFDSSGQVKASVIVIPGTPGSGAPALPTNCAPLRDVVVPAGLSAGNGGLAASNLGTDRRRYLSVTNEVNVWRQMSAQNTWANQTSFGVIPVAADRTACTLTMIKNSAATALAVNFDASQVLNSGTAQQLLAGLRINGADFVLAVRHTTVNASVRVDLHASRRLMGIAAGTLTIEPVFASQAASQVIMYAADDMISYTVREVV